MIEFVIKGTCEKLDQVPEGARIQTVDDREVVQLCECCKKPIFYGDRADSFEFDDDGSYWHKECS